LHGFEVKRKARVHYYETCVLREYWVKTKSSIIKLMLKPFNVIYYKAV